MTTTEEKRKCFVILIDQFNERGYIPSVVVEGEPGHSPMIGSGELAEPWYWGTDYEQAKAICRSANEDLGLSCDAVNEIITSSMAAGNANAARLEELGLSAAPGSEDRSHRTRERLVREGKIT